MQKRVRSIYLKYENDLALVKFSIIHYKISQVAADKKDTSAISVGIKCNYWELSK